MRFFILLFLAASITLYAASAFAETATPPDLTGTPWEGMTVPPDTKLVETTNKKGNRIRHLRFAGGVTFTEMENGQYIASDNSGKGAVGCIEHILLDIKKTMEVCGAADAGAGNAEQAYFWLSIHQMPPDISPRNSANAEKAAALKKAQDLLSPEQKAEIDSRILAWKPAPSGIGMTEPKYTEEDMKAAPARAEAGDAEAQYIYANTKTYFMDPETAGDSLRESLLWLHKAAEQGHLMAQFSLATHLKDGHGIRPDFEESVKWYTRAAEQGHAPSQLALGLMLTHGIGKMPINEFKRQIDSALDKIATFRAANSPNPITREEALHRQRTYTLPYGCIGGSAAVSDSMREKSPAEFEKMIDDMLSVPRPPVNNPCL